MHMLVVLLGLVSALRAPGTRSTRTASYRIEASLDEKSREVRGEETLTWRNDANGPADRLVFHLYMNAFKNEQSTFLRERIEHESPAVPERKWGFIRTGDVTVTRTGAVQHAQLVVPEHGDQTLATLALDRPVAPGETIEVSMSFTTRLPEIVARTGTHDGFYAVAQWFPKIGVFTCDGTCRFVADAHHAQSEFFADFGTYDVVLDLPSQLGMGATGVRTQSEARGVRQRVTYRAEDVHDFVFTADARFVEHALDVDDGSGLPPVHVVVLGEPGLEANVPRHLAAASATLKELGRRLGPYPYTQLTVVQVPHGAEEAGGMEYPTLFFTSDEPVPASARIVELVTAHEAAHQWLQGILASDEVHEAWLDEGLTELATGWVLATLTPPTALLYRLLGHEVTYVDLERQLLGRGFPDIVDQPAYSFSSGAAYAQLTYRKTALVLATLAARMGEPAFEHAMRTYYEAHRFTHPHRVDLFAAFAAAPEVLRTLLVEGLTQPGSLDYAVTRVETEQVRPDEGLFDDADGGTHEVGESHDPTAAWHSTIVVERVGSYVLPVTVRMRFADGSERDTLVDLGRDRRWQRLELDGKSALVEARLHPLNDTPLDTDRLDDSMRVEADPAPRRTLTASLQVLTALALSWIVR